MIVPVSSLLKIENIDKYKLTFNRKDPSVAAIYIISHGNIEKSYNITKEYLSQLQQRGVVKVSINTDRDSMKLLKKIVPDIFFEITGEMNISNLFQLAGEYDTMNIKSLKKRSLRLLEDVYSADINITTGTREILLEYGTLLNSKTISRVKKNIDPTQKVFFKDSEEGVLVFVPEVKDFKLKVDLFAILSTFDFPIYDAQSILDAVEIYKTKSPKLVILGNLGGSLESKKALLDIEEYDPYVKKLNYDESPASNRQFETERIKNSYYSGYTKFLEVERMSKESLPDEIKDAIYERLQKLQNSWSIEDYVETAYAIKQFGRVFNVTALWHMLNNIKKRYG